MGRLKEAKRGLNASKLAQKPPKATTGQARISSASPKQRRGYQMSLGDAEAVSGPCQLTLELPGQNRWVKEEYRFAVGGERQPQLA